MLMNNEKSKVHDRERSSSDRTRHDGAEEKLKASLTYRHQHPSEDKEESRNRNSDVGTADHRPSHGLIYDAPLGLKF